RRPARVDPAASSRLTLGQLLGIRLADAKAFLLCAVKWLSVSVEFELRIGVQSLPGIPQGAAIRAIGAPAAAERYTPAFLLPAVAALQAPETLVVPAGWFKPNREIEVLTERTGKLRLASVVDRGADFDRVTFEALCGALAGMPHACSALLALLEEIEAHPPRHSAYLQILERLRYPVMHAETEQAMGFAGKPLPLGHDEAVAFVQANGLWAAMLRAYGRLLSAALNGKHPELEASLPRLFQRVLACAGEVLGTCVLARREFGADYWKLMHQGYAAAEARAIR